MDKAAVFAMVFVGGNDPIIANPTMKGWWTGGESLKSPWVANIILLGR